MYLLKISPSEPADGSHLFQPRRRFSVLHVCSVQDNVSYDCLLAVVVVVLVPYP